MNTWKYFDITHRFHSSMNPIRPEKLERFISLLPIRHKSEVLDIGCGKGEILIQLSEKYQIKGIGVDISPFAIKEAKERTKNQLEQNQIKYIEMEGQKFVDNNIDTKYDITICIGSSWIFGGHKNTLKALQNITKENGLIIVGEPFWKDIPSQWYLEESRIELDEFGTHASNVIDGEELGLRPIFSLTSSDEDWEYYEHRQWLGIDDHLINHPNDPDNEKLITDFNRSKDAYLKEGRNVFGWALYAFRNISPPVH